MVNYFVYAKDFSGSTCENRHFHSNGLKSLEQFKIDVEKIKKELSDAGEPPTESKTIYLHWGDECNEVDEEITRLAYIEMQGNMGTEPRTIIQWLQQNYDICGENNEIKLLYIITDGLIGHPDADECFKLNENMKYETVVFHAFNECTNAIDLSVAASFFKSRSVVYRNYELFDNIDISKEFDYSTIHVHNFTTEKDNLKSYIKLKFIKTLGSDASALREIDKLKKLRERLFHELSSELDRGEVFLDTKDRNVFLRDFITTDWYKDLASISTYATKVDIEKSVSSLINYIVSEKKSYSFDAVKFDTNYNNLVEKEPIVDVSFTTEQEIEFPDIILDDDRGIPVIILTRFSLLDKMIFHITKTSTDVSSASFSKFKSAMECPLFLVDDPDIGESIGYFYTLNVYRQLLARSVHTEPRTRRPFHGGLVLTDTDHFDRYNDYVVAATYFDFKKVYCNIGLFYFVLWKNCENKQWMDRNVVEQFKKYTMRRISKTVCKIGLSSLPLDPRIDTSLPTALWYCVELSSCIFKNDPQHFMHERLRMFCGVAHYMIEVLKYFDYDLDIESIEKRRELISHVTILKRIPAYREKVYYLLESIFKNVGSFLVSEIEKPFNLQKLNYLKLNHKEMLRNDVTDDKVHLNDYIHLMHCVGDFNESKSGKMIKSKHAFVCETTFRPFFAIEQNKSFYTELVNITKKIVIENDDDKDKIKLTHEAIDSLEFDKILSLYNLFIKCVQDSGKYPTLAEYIEYVSRKKKFKDHLVTIFPPDVYEDAEAVYGLYQVVMTRVDVDTFVSASKTYVRRCERVKAENKVKFSNENEITEFIRREELKVNLQKRTQT